MSNYCQWDPITGPFCDTGGQATYCSPRHYKPLPHTLYRNNGNGTFTDATQGSGIVPTQWSTSAVWFDFDNDGRLDLFVAEFGDYTDNKVCSLAGSYGGNAPSLPTAQSYYCHPKLLKSASSHLYRNLGSGKFADVSQAMELAQPGKAWGTVATDIDNDGYMDLFVSNDTVPNRLWLNENGQKFVDIGLESGVAYSNDGVPRSGQHKRIRGRHRAMVPAPLRFEWRDYFFVTVTSTFAVTLVARVVGCHGRRGGRYRDCGSAHLLVPSRVFTRRDRP